MLTFASPRHVIHSTTNTLESMSEELGKKTFSLSIDDQVICASSFLRRFNHCMLWDDDAVATSFSHSYHDAVQLKLATHREPVAVFSIGISTLDGNDMVVLHSLSDGSIICIPRNQESGSSSHLLSSLGSRPIPEPRKDDDSSDIERLTTSILGVSSIAPQEIAMQQTASEDRDWLGQTADIPPQESDDTSDSEDSKWLLPDKLMPKIVPEQRRVISVEVNRKVTMITALRLHGFDDFLRPSSDMLSPIIAEILSCDGYRLETV